MEPQHSPITPVILAGGIGERLWPLSHPDRPKQCLTLPGMSRSLLQTTLARIDSPLFTAPLLVTGKSQYPLIATQCQAAGLIHPDILCEPARRNTAAAVTLAAQQLAAYEPDSLMLVMPADHYLPDTTAFHASISDARTAAQEAWLVIFGMTPTRAETGYGYILPGDVLSISPSLRRIETFTEKPDTETATQYLAEKKYLWNSGMLLCRADVFLREAEQHMSAIVAACRNNFSTAPSISIDRALLEKTQRAAVLPVSFAWDDLGHWQTLWQVSPKDGNGNVLWGENIHARNCTNCLIYSDSEPVDVQDLHDTVLITSSAGTLRQSLV